MKEIEIIDNGNFQNKLTITSSKIRIKLQQNLTKSEQNRVIIFFKIVAEFFDDKNFDITFRGGNKLIDDTLLQLDMYNDSRKINFHFTEII